MYSLIEWHDSAQALVRAAQPFRGNMLEIEGGVLAEPQREGWCVVCEQIQSFTVHGGATFAGDINLREGLVCPSCGINARSRLLFRAMAESFPTREARLALLEHFSPLAGAVRRNWPQVECSEFMQPGGEPGAMLSRMLADGTTASARHEDLLRLSYADGSLDGLVHNDVLEHVPDVSIALRECRRVLRPGGHAVFTMPWFPWAPTTRVRGRLHEDGSLEELLPTELHGDGLRAEGVYTFYNFGADLGAMLAAAGFAQVRYGLSYMPSLGFFTNNYRYGEDGLMMPTVIRATA